MEGISPMKLLIAVKSCVQHLDLGYHDVIRETWGKDAKLAGMDVRFFTGPSFQHREPDEVVLDCPDDYNNLPKKTQAICKWAIGKTYGHIFLCDTDTFLIPVRMLTHGIGNYDYAGKIDRTFGETFSYRTVSRDGVMENHPDTYPWASGGFGYFLSRKAFHVIADTTPIGWAEDFLVGQALGPLYRTGEISMLNTPANQYSWHFPAHEYKSGYDLSFKWMEKMYESNR
jgi:galactosyltransferase